MRAFSTGLKQPSSASRGSHLQHGSISWALHLLVVNVCLPNLSQMVRRAVNLVRCDSGYRIVDSAGTINQESSLHTAGACTCTRPRV